MENWQDISKEKFSLTYSGKSEISEKEFSILQSRILDRMDLSRQMNEEEIRDAIDEEILREGKARYLGFGTKAALRKEIFYEIRQLGILQDLIYDPDITEIMVNGTEPIFIEKRGKLERLNIRFESVEKLNHVIQQIVADCNRVVNEASPIVDARLKDGSRVNAVLYPVALNGPVLTIRRFPDKAITMEQLNAIGSVSREASAFLEKLVKAGCNILVSGGTGCGKTTFLNALSGFIPKEQRVITIEDSAELQLQGLQNLVRLETRNANVEGCLEITIRDLIRASLRMRPDRIIVGEVRGKEAVDMLQSVNVGHCAMTTVHANSARDVTSRLETMVLMGMELPVAAIRKQIVSGFDILIHLGRLRDGSRRVMEIAEPVSVVDGEVKLHMLYRFEEKGQSRAGLVAGELVKVGELRNVEKLKAAGYQE
ncbi:MAG: CpaF family protein [Lachnospiraceae bacterium]|nr:CpaF family protein [Lachnospiraceae bacterium]